jgi:phage/plasmid-associated DNA primase
VERLNNSPLHRQPTSSNWMTECTEDAPQVETASTTLFLSWKNWCEQNGEYAGSSKVFGQKLSDHGIFSRHTNKGTVFRGIRVTG